MALIDDLSTLTQPQIEDVEKLTLRWIFQATLDFGMEAYEIFLQSPDKPKDVAEDVTREVLDRLPGYNVQQRVYGTVDYKKARYIVLPEKMIRQALFVDSKAEKTDVTATLQMSQISMEVIQLRSGQVISEKGKLPEISVYGGKQYLTTTAFLHFKYEDVNHKHHLINVIMASIPNGKLQRIYNPTSQDTIWRVGRNAPSRGEDFRVRLSFRELGKKATWRVQKIFYNRSKGLCYGQWSE